MESTNDDSLFAFPELKASFTPKHGDVLCFRACDLSHCTRTFKETNLFGLAFFQKASLFKQLKKLLDLPVGGILEYVIPKRGKIPAMTIIEKKKDFEMKSLLYKKELKEGEFSFLDV